MNRFPLDILFRPLKSTRNTEENVTVKYMGIANPHQIETRCLSVKIPGVILLLILQFLVFIFNANAQLDFQLTQPKISIKTPGLVTFTVRVINTGDKLAKGILSVAAASELQVISQNNLTINLAGGDSIFLPIKILPTYDLEAGDHLVRLTLSQLNKDPQFSDTDRSTKITREGVLTLLKFKSVTISARQSSIQLLGNEDSVQVPVRLVNTGNVSAQLSLVASLPQRTVGGDNIHRPLVVSLNRNADTTVYIAQKLPRKLRGEAVGAGFQVNVMGFYTGGDQIGQVSVQVHQLSSQGKAAYGPEMNYIVPAANSIAVTAQNVTGGNGYYWVNGGSSIYLPAGVRANWHLDGSVYQYDPGRPYLRDTWLNLEKNGHGITVGNLNRNLDLNLYGRGAAIYTMDSLHSNYYEAGLIDHSANLLQGNNRGVAGGSGSGGNFSLNNGMAAWALIRHQFQQHYWQTAALYQQDELTATNNTLITNDFRWVNKKAIRIEASLSGGLSADQHNPNRQKAGMLASLNFSGVLHKKLGYNSNNIYSTGYYPGQRRGARVFSERLSYKLGQLGLWSAFNYYNYQPKTVSSIQRYNSEYGSLRAEMGISARLRAVNLTFSPYYTSSSSLYYTLGKAIKPKISAFRVLSQINYNKNKFSTYLSADLGIASNSLSDHEEFQWHLNSSLQYGFFSVSGSMQVGSFYATDALNSYMYGNQRYKIYTVSPRIQHNFFHNNLQLSGGFSYNYISSSGRNLSIDTRAAYRLTEQSQLTVSYMRYATGYFNHSSNNLQLGFTTKLPTLRAGTSKNSLELFFFKDMNGNGSYDKSVDAVAAGQQITISNRVFITDKNGRILYKNLPEGTYNVSNLLSTEWYAAAQSILLNQKKLLVRIPLHKIGLVEGAVSYSYTRFSYELNRQKQGLTIKATDTKGTVYTTLTDEYGHYTLYLPTGAYQVYIDETYLPRQIECTSKRNEVQIQSSGSKNLDFVLHVKDRKVETKKFYSTSLTKNETASINKQEIKDNKKGGIKGDQEVKNEDKAPSAGASSNDRLPGTRSVNPGLKPSVK